MNIPLQIWGKLHVIDSPTIEDIQNLITNGKTQENISLLLYWMQKIQEKGRDFGTLFPFYEDAVFLGVIEWKWFLQELKESKTRSRRETK